MYHSASGSVYSSGITPRPPSRPPRAGRPYHAPDVSVPFTPHKPFRGLSVLTRGETPLAAVRKHRGTDCLRSRPLYRPESQSPRPVPLPTPPAPPRSPGRTARSLLRRSPTAYRQRFFVRLLGYHHVLGGLHPSHALTVDPWASSSVRRALVCRCAWCTSMCRFSAGTVEDPSTPQPHSSPLAALGPLSLTLGPLSFPHGCLGRHLQRTGSEHTWLCELVLSLNTALSRNLGVGCGPYDVDFPECCSLCSRSTLDSASDVVYPPY